MRAWRSTFCVAVAFAALVAACSATKEPRKGELVLSIQTDMAIPKDVDSIRLEVSAYGNLLFGNDYAVGPAGLRIPATIALVAGEQKGTAAHIRLIARQSGALRVVRDVVTTVPDNRVALLRLPIHWLCVGTAKETAGQVESTCAAGQTCVGGQCAGVEVDVQTLPDYHPEDVFGGGNGSGSGTCLDTVACFAAGQSVHVDMGTCTIDKPLAAGQGTNVALVVPPGGGGICGPEACLVPLDSGSAAGWVESNGRVALPKAACDAINAGAALGVAVTTACETKTERSPTCGAWSSVQRTSSPGDAGPVTLINLLPAEAGADAAREEAGSYADSGTDTSLARDAADSGDAGGPGDGGDAAAGADGPNGGNDGGDAAAGADGPNGGNDGGDAAAGADGPNGGNDGGDAGVASLNLATWKASCETVGSGAVPSAGWWFAGADGYQSTSTLTEPCAADGPTTNRCGPYPGMPPFACSAGGRDGSYSAHLAGTKTATGSVHIGVVFGGNPVGSTGVTFWYKSTGPANGGKIVFQLGMRQNFDNVTTNAGWPTPGGMCQPGDWSQAQNVDQCWNLPYQDLPAAAAWTNVTVRWADLTWTPLYQPEPAWWPAGKTAIAANALWFELSLQRINVTPLLSGVVDVWLDDVTFTTN